MTRATHRRLVLEEKWRQVKQWATNTGDIQQGSKLWWRGMQIHWTETLALLLPPQILPDLTISNVCCHEFSLILCSDVSFTTQEEAFQSFRLTAAPSRATPNPPIAQHYSRSGRIPAVTGYPFFSEGCKISLLITRVTLEQTPLILRSVVDSWEETNGYSVLC